MDQTQDEMRTRVYRPNYVKAADLQTLITPLLTPQIGKITVSSPVRSRHSGRPDQDRRQQLRRHRRGHRPRLRSRPAADRPDLRRGRCQAEAGRDRGDDPQRQAERHIQVRRQLSSRSATRTTSACISGTPLAEPGRHQRRREGGLQVRLSRRRAWRCSSTPWKRSATPTSSPRRA